MMQVVSCSSEFKNGVKSLTLNNDVARITILPFLGAKIILYTVFLWLQRLWSCRGQLDHSPRAISRTIWRLSLGIYKLIFNFVTCLLHCNSKLNWPKSEIMLRCNIQEAKFDKKRKKMQSVQINICTKKRFGPCTDWTFLNCYSKIWYTLVWSIIHTESFDSDKTL